MEDSNSSRENIRNDARLPFEVLSKSQESIEEVPEYLEERSRNFNQKNAEINNKTFNQDGYSDFYSFGENDPKGKLDSSSCFAKQNSK